jgi:hypothetical protein
LNVTTFAAANETELNLIDAGLGTENVPFWPLLGSDRNMDVIIAIDSSADTDNYPDGQEPRHTCLLPFHRPPHAEHTSDAKIHCQQGIERNNRDMRVSPSLTSLLRLNLWLKVFTKSLDSSDQSVPPLHPLRLSLSFYQITKSISQLVPVLSHPLIQSPISYLSSTMGSLSLRNKNPTEVNGRVVSRVL